MAMRISRLASNLALAACLSMAATPALAGGGWGGGWGRGHHRHHGGDDAGWIIGGIIGIGIIAAMASSASKTNREREARERDSRYPDRDYRSENRDYRGDDRGGYGANRDGGYSPSSANRGIDGAVDSCVAEVERGSTRVDTVESVDRDGEGWRVEGRTNGGKPFACSVGSSGRIRSVTVDGRAAMAEEEPERAEG